MVCKPVCSMCIIQYCNIWFCIYFAAVRSESNCWTNFFGELKTSIWRTTSGGKRTGTHHKDKVAKFKCSNQSIDIQWVKIGVGIYSLQDPKLVSIKTFGTTITFLIFQWTQSWCVIIIPPQHCLAELLKKTLENVFGCVKDYCRRLISG